MRLPARSIFLLVSLLLALLSCNQPQEPPLFVLKGENVAPFHNNLEYTEAFNPYTYRNFYNGGGVALGDINNDGLTDIYFTGNLVDNKMYLNKGNWLFEDVTEQTGLACPNVWSSGANFVDINGDGLLDLYVCKAGKPGGDNRHNELFINKGNLQFEEQSAEYGLDIEGLSIQSAFFDYDRDGDLDCYLLNNSLRSVGGFDLVKGRREIPGKNGNKFFENQNGKFVDVTEEAGIYSSDIGYGLGITLSDFNQDGWTDIYISNDFFEKDYLYLNNQNKTFTEKGEDYFQCFPLGSMGADVADLDNDLLPDLMITEMLPHSIHRKKTKAIYDSWNKYSLSVNNGYHHQFPRNMLQRNMGSAGFLEIGRQAGVEATDWSWSSLMQDFDNDGLKDIIVANGIGKDLLDRDYLAFSANRSAIQQNIQSGDAITKLIDAMPSQSLSNFAFKNKGDFNFENSTAKWGLNQKSFSNGCAYADLDNDGDLDLVVNNVNMPSFIFENTSEQSGNHFLKVNLEGDKANTKAIGAKIIVYACGQTLMTEQFPSRGFQSSVSNQLLLGLGKCEGVDSLKVIWPDGTYDLLADVVVNTTLGIKKAPAGKEYSFLSESTRLPLFKSEKPVAVTHRQAKFNQFNRERLLMKMNTAEGPAIAVADINQDGQPDIFAGGGKGQTSTILLSTPDGTKKIDFGDPVRSEVVEALFFDCDADGDEDLYVANGGTAFSPQAIELHDELYINDGQGNFSEQKNALDFSRPVATGAVAISDFNQDGLPDIFVGERNGNNAYGVAGSGFLFQNLGQGQFQKLDIPLFENLGMITAAAWLDINQDELPDLVVAGEWMSLTFFLNTGNGFEQQQMGLEKTSGMWNTLLIHDFNKDGKDDIFAGNIGENTSLSIHNKLIVNDFDGNGSIEQILAEEVDGQVYPVLDMDELMSQVPILKRKFVYYKDYAAATVEQLVGASVLEKSTILHLDILASQLYIQKNGAFEGHTLPREVQYSSVHTAIANDFDKDGDDDLLLGGNHYLVKPQFGREDASKGWYIENTSRGQQLDFTKIYPLNIAGQIRDFELSGSDRVLIGINNQAIRSLSY